MIPGQRFGNYLLKEKIAQGGMAEIFYAERTGAMDFSRPVCIKRIRPALCTDPSFVQMFIDEARTSSFLRHGNIISVEDFGQVDGQLYLAMEWVHGVDASRLAKDLAAAKQPMPVEVALHLVERVLAGLEYAHGKVQDGRALEIVHRDISPHNVLVSYAGDVKLTDFGIAKASSRLHRTLGDVVKGKLPYMAPEQARGVGDLDGRADLFAVGVMAFELLAGRRPFVGNEADLIASLITGRRPSLRSLRPDVPPPVEAFVDALLETDRELRPPSASAAIDALQALGVARGDRAMRSLLGRLYPDKVSVITPTPPSRAVSPPRGVPSGVAAVDPHPVITAVERKVAASDLESAPTEPDRRSVPEPLRKGPTGTDAVERLALPEPEVGTAVLRAPPVAPSLSQPAATKPPISRAARNVAIVMATTGATALALVVAVQVLADSPPPPVAAPAPTPRLASPIPPRPTPAVVAPAPPPRPPPPALPEPTTAPAPSPVTPAPSGPVVARPAPVPLTTVVLEPYGRFHFAGQWHDDRASLRIPRGSHVFVMQLQGETRRLRVNVVPGQTVRLRWTEGDR